MQCCITNEHQVLFCVNQLVYSIAECSEFNVFHTIYVGKLDLAARRCKLEMTLPFDTMTMVPSLCSLHIGLLSPAAERLLRVFHVHVIVETRN